MEGHWKIQFLGGWHGSLPKHPNFRGRAWKTNMLGVNLLESGRELWNGGTFLLTTMLIGIKYRKHITLCDTNTLILLIIVTIIYT